jgi:DNA modification methylase
MASLETSHEVVTGDARELGLSEDSVELVVTSPPYPMIEMWDDAFAGMDPEVEAALEAGEGERAFEAMHAQLDRVWDELVRVLAPGGVACINVGDATRSVDGDFRVYDNHARILRALKERGLTPLPDVLWRKPANSAAKFMGSGMLPTNAYATLEHEYVLVLRNGGLREFPPGDRRRYESAYFWEERNEWFSDVWTDVRGVAQDVDPDDLPAEEGEIRERSGAYPFAIPYRLVNMFSVYGDTVLDPFLGTGTTTVAAMAAGRNSVGYEVDPAFAAVLHDRVEGVRSLSRAVIDRRIRDHREFAAGADLSYDAEHYDFPVRTKQERRIRFYGVEAVERTDEGYGLTHTPVDD